MNEGTTVTTSDACTAAGEDIQKVEVFWGELDPATSTEFRTVVCDDTDADSTNNCGVITTTNCAASHTYHQSLDGNGTSTNGDHTLRCVVTGSVTTNTSQLTNGLLVNEVSTIVDAQTGPGTNAYTTPEDVAFTPQAEFNDASMDPDATGQLYEAYSCTIDWGDASPIYSRDPCTPATLNTSHVYSTPGSYTMTVTVTNKDSDASTNGATNPVSNTATVTVTDTNPTIGAISASPDPGIERQSITFSSSLTAPADEPIQSCQWEWGDGSPAEPEPECVPGSTSVTVSAPHTFGDGGSTEGTPGGPYNVVLRVFDADSNATGSKSQTVNNDGSVVAAPTSASTLAEGSSITWSSSFVDSPDTAWRADWDYLAGGGFEANTVNILTTGGISTTTTYSTVGSAGLAVTVLARVRDNTTSGGGATANSLDGSNSANFTILDADPVITAAATLTTNEGAVATFRANIASGAGDAGGGLDGSDPIDSCIWDPGDGSGAQIFAVDDPECGGTVGPNNSVFTHTYADNGTYTATLRVVDEDSSTLHAITVTINNVAPTVVINSDNPDPSVEGGTVAAANQVVTLNFTVDDQGLLANEVRMVTINWGETGGTPEVFCDDDGATTPGTCSEGTFNATHTYTDDAEDACGAATCTITVTATDKDNATGSDTEAHDVDNLNPIINGVTLVSPVAEGSPVSVSVDATDPGTGDLPSLRYSFDWQDDGCNASQGDFCNATLSGASYFYPDEGSYTIRITVTDDDGGSATTTRTAVVTDTKPIIVSTFNTAPKDEGQSVTAVVNMNLQDGDAYSITYDWGDGQTTGPTSARTATHSYGDQGSYTITVTVLDDEGNSTSGTSTASISNVPPAVSTVGCGASSGLSYSCDVNGTDVAADTVSYAVSFGPSGMSVNASTGVVSWTPTGDQTRSSHSFQVKVSDEDGGEALITRTVTTYQDTDSDGMPDAWETQYGTNPNVDDASADADGDGRTNAEEFADGTDPFVWEGPNTPVAKSPADGSETTDMQPVLRVRNAMDESGAALTYTFEVFSDASLTTLVTSTSGVAEGTVFMDGAYHTEWMVNVALMENTEYWWRARANNGDTNGGNTGVSSFFVNVANDAPGMATLSAPQSGTEVPTLFPTLEIGNATDDDRDELTYTFEVATTNAFTTIVASQSGVPAGNGTTSWVVDTALSDNTTYYWRARAVDADGAAGPNTAAGSFFVNTTNNPPSAVTLQGPADGSEVASATPALSITNATDADADVLVYHFEIDTSPAFNAPIASGPVTEGAAGQTSFTPTSALSENTEYYWRARAFDGTAAGDWATGSFFVNVTNDAPGQPVAQNPVDGSLVDRNNVRFTVRNTTDPDRDPVSYVFTIWKDEAMTVEHEVSGVLTAGSNGETSYVPTARLSAGKTYWWTATAQDDSALEGTASAAQEFRTVGGGGGGGCSVATSERDVTPALAALLLGLVAIVHKRRRIL